MPKRTDLKKILIIGAGPIVIGQACEFDYSGTQACKALREEGYTVVLVNSNPATIMTDPSFADRTYIEPVTPEIVAKIIERERPDALLPTMGGQTALNVAVALAESGVLEKFGVELIGAKLEAIQKAEDREKFKAAMEKIGLSVPKSGFGHTLEECRHIGQAIIGSFPLIVRPSFTLGGSGGGIAYNQEEFEAVCRTGLEASPTSQVLIEESALGWKEYELEVMRDLADNVVIICSIENIDPMGVHTGDSVTVAPAQTLTDKEYQRLRDASIAVIREIGVETGGSNIQFAIHPETGKVIVIEMNPRVSRSSALASKATGFPIAKIAAKLAVGFTLDEIPNDITQETPASFEPTIDYVVTKIPRFAFEKFPGSEPILTTQMKSVGEAMSIGRTFNESFQKALRSMELGRFGFGADRPVASTDLGALLRAIRTPNPERLFQIHDALRAGASVEEIYNITKIDPWFLDKFAELVALEKQALVLKEKGGLDTLSLEEQKDWLWEYKQNGYSDQQLGYLLGSSEQAIRSLRKTLGINPVYKTVDTCAAEFEAFTPYHYSTYESETELRISPKRKVMILGGGPNRIGQGIEFDYCCCHACFALSEDGFETIMVNSNPETVSTDYDTSDILFFEPLTREDVLNIVEVEKPEGVIVQFGGQTPLKLAVPLEKAGVPIWGTTPDAIDRAEDRERFEQVLRALDIRQPNNGIARSHGEALEAAQRVGYPVVVRPSYVLGGRAMEIVYSDRDLERYMTTALPLDLDITEHPILIDQFLEGAVEVDVDAVCDRTGRVVIGGIMEHIEEAGIHSGDSACVLPARSLSEAVLQTIRDWTVKLARSLKVVGLMNVQYAVQEEQVYVLEVNPRASRTVPFVSKAIGVPLAMIAARLMSGKTLEELGFTQEVIPKHVAVKEAVLPFEKFSGTDLILGPEMRSTGEVMGIDMDFGAAFAKAQLAAGQRIPIAGKVFISVVDRDKNAVIPVVKDLLDLSLSVVCTRGTQKFLAERGLVTEEVLKIHEGRPHIEDLLKNGQIQLVINTPTGSEAQSDGRRIRRTALAQRVPVITTIAGAIATAQAIRALQKGPLQVKTIQEYHGLATDP
ncbi:MAG: carbamoyl-phosphate synthase large subunit [Gloeobacterales cyanobacterium]